MHNRRSGQHFSHEFTGGAYLKTKLSIHWYNFKILLKRNLKHAIFICNVPSSGVQSNHNKK